MRADVREKHGAWKPDPDPNSLVACMANPALKPYQNPTNDYQNTVNRAISMRKMFQM